MLFMTFSYNNNNNNNNSDGARNLEVMLESLSGGRRQEIQEDGIVMEVFFLFKCSRR